MPATQEMFGQMPDGTDVICYTLTNEYGVSASFLNLGAVWKNMLVPDCHGKVKDVVLGLDCVNAYLDNQAHLGSVIGRNANRIANATYTLNGVSYDLEINNGPNNLHSGSSYYDIRIWQAEYRCSELGECIQFSLSSPHLDQGHPGNAEISVTYTLTPDSALMIEYHMVCDQDTIANFTNHAYFNLSGHESGNAMNQLVWIDSDYFTIANEDSIPTGEFVRVEHTPMDFRSRKSINQDLEADDVSLKRSGGYDQNWVLKECKEDVALCAKAMSLETGIEMEVYTDLPGLHFYTANFLKEGLVGKDQVVYGPRHGYCFETQHYPDAMNQEAFPSPVLKAGNVYHKTTIYKFSHQPFL